MKTVQRTTFVAFDGTEFGNAPACRAHEREHAPKRLVGLTWEQVHAACNRDDPDLAEAIEIVGAKIAEMRRQSGELKRRRRPLALGASEATEPEADESEGEAEPSTQEPPVGDGLDPPQSLDRRT